MYVIDKGDKMTIASPSSFITSRNPKVFISFHLQHSSKYMDAMGLRLRLTRGATPEIQRWEAVATKHGC
jgi:hypothetical protein